MWPSPESQREKREFLMVAPGQDHPGRHPNEDLLLEALDEFDAVESTPLKLCRPSLQNSQDDIRGSIGDGSRLDLNEEIVSTVSAVVRTPGLYFWGDFCVMHAGSGVCLHPGLNR